MKRRSLVGVLIILGISWVAFITIYIAMESHSGATTPEELRSKYSAAIHDRDAQKLGELIDYPTANAIEFSRSYLKKLELSGVHSVSTTLDDVTDSGGVLRVEGTKNDGERFTYSLALHKIDSNWLIVLMPPL